MAGWGGVGRRACLVSLFAGIGAACRFPKAQWPLRLVFCFSRTMAPATTSDGRWCPKACLFVGIGAACRFPKAPWPLRLLFCFSRTMAPATTSDGRWCPKAPPPRGPRPHATTMHGPMPPWSCMHARLGRAVCQQQTAASVAPQRAATHAGPCGRGQTSGRDPHPRATRRQSRASSAGGHAPKSLFAAEHRDVDHVAAARRRRRRRAPPPSRPPAAAPAAARRRAPILSSGRHHHKWDDGHDRSRCSSGTVRRRWGRGGATGPVLARMSRRCGMCPASQR